MQYTVHHDHPGALAVHRPQTQTEAIRLLQHGQFRRSPPRLFDLCPTDDLLLHHERAAVREERPRGSRHVLRLSRLDHSLSIHHQLASSGPVYPHIHQSVYRWTFSFSSKEIYPHPSSVKFCLLASDLTRLGQQRRGVLRGGVPFRTDVLPNADRDADQLPILLVFVLVPRESLSR